MTFLIITTDDFCPQSMSLWMHWQWLKKMHPRLKLTAFVPAKYLNKSSNDIIRNKEFWKWRKETKAWIEIAAHGMTHTYPPEFTKFRNHQERIIKKMTGKLRRYFPLNKGFKAPFYKMNDVTIEIIKKHNYAYIAHWNTIFFLHHIVPNSPPYMLEHSHSRIPDGNPEENTPKDNINLIRNVLHRKLKKWESRGITYLTINEYIERHKER